jgi:hypothetical protein
MTEKEKIAPGPLFCVTILLSWAGFVLFIFTCIALTHSDTEAFYSACGHTLRYLMMTNIIVNTIVVLALTLIVYIITVCVKGKAAIVTVVTFLVLYILFNIIMPISILSYSLTALDDPTCKSAMQSTDGGINSVSADTGGAILAITGMVNSIFNLVLLCIFVCCLACSMPFYLYMKSRLGKIGS